MELPVLRLHQFTELQDTFLQLFTFTPKDIIMATITTTMDSFMSWDMLSQDIITITIIMDIISVIITITMVTTN